MPAVVVSDSVLLSVVAKLQRINGAPEKDGNASRGHELFELAARVMGHVRTLVP
jgi:hypothetical protein